MKPVTRSNGISSQDNGAQEHKGRMGARPMPGNIGKNASHVTNPRMGTKGGGDKLGSMSGRKGK